MQEDLINKSRNFSNDIIGELITQSISENKPIHFCSTIFKLNDAARKIKKDQQSKFDIYVNKSLSLKPEKRIVQTMSPYHDRNEIKATIFKEKAKEIISPTNSNRGASMNSFKNKEKMNIFNISKKKERKFRTISLDLNSKIINKNVSQNVTQNVSQNTITQNIITQNNSQITNNRVFKINNTSNKINSKLKDSSSQIDLHRLKIEPLQKLKKLNFNKINLIKQINRQENETISVTRRPSIKKVENNVKESNKSNFFPKISHIRTNSNNLIIPKLIKVANAINNEKFKKPTIIPKKNENSNFIKELRGTNCGSISVINLMRNFNIRKENFPKKLDLISLRRK